MAWKWCTSEAAIALAGKDHPTISSTNLSGSILAEFSRQVEANINLATRYDWNTNAASISNYFSGALAKAEASGVAKMIINYDPTSYPGLAYAQTLLNVVDQIYGSAVKEINENKDMLGA